MFSIKINPFFTDFYVMILRTKKNIPLKLMFLMISGLLLFSCQSVPKSTETSEIIREDDVETPEQETGTPENQPVETQIPETTETSPEKISLSRKIADKGQLSATQLAEYFLSQRKDYDYIEIVHFAQLYIVEAAAEEINSDVAFAQMCLETGYLRFGGLVQPEFHNYCGLGAMDAENPGCIFETEQLGVRAHIQHLQAYATHEDELLNNELIDPRYSWVHKTKYIETIEGLTGTWATDPNYAVKIENILSRMEEMVN